MTGRLSRGSTTRTSVDTTAKCTMNMVGAKIRRCIYAISIGLTINQGSNAVLKAEGFVSDEDSEVEKIKPVYCRNCKEANIKNAKWCMKCGMVLSFTGYQEALKEQKYKDEKINLIEKQLEAQSNQLKALISALGNINDDMTQGSRNQSDIGQAVQDGLRITTLLMGEG
jgi:hypothetical protein